MCDTYLMSYYKNDIIDILKDENENKHFSLNLDFIEMSGNEPNLVNNFLKEPEQTLEKWDSDLKKVQNTLMLESENAYLFKNNVHCRIYSLPTYQELHRTKVPQNDDVNKFLQVSGTVVRMTGMKMLEYKRQYTCTKCKHAMMVNAEYAQKNVIIPPKRCQNPDHCNGTNIISLGEVNSEFCKDYQELRMQETVSKLDVRSNPQFIWVTLEDDLVDSCKPGDHITVCGLVQRRSEPFIVGKKMETELVIKANHITVNNDTSVLSITPQLKNMFEAFWTTYGDTPLVARDIVVKSICPELYGLFLAKLGVAVVLAGGSNLSSNSDTGVRVRAESHLLLVGDPGTGKSQLLRFASKIIPRSVLTTGVGSTAAGLTAAAIKENGEWQLESGALVMSDGGICCIDEFNTMKEHDRTSIHEAMEQQTISVAKAGIVCKLSTRCSILAATNPKGKLDPTQPLNMNVALPGPLLSRFDLILLIRDKIQDEWDSQQVDYIFSLLKKTKSSKLNESINWTIETLQAYFAVIKKLHPVLTEDSNRILSSYYQAQRRKNYRNKARTTVRLLDSLIRLSQGHARLMYHKEVEVVDAVVAVTLVETSMEADSSVFNLSFDVRNDFPQDPEGNYRELAEIVLKKLKLDELLNKENKRGPSIRPGTSKASSSSTIQKTESKFFHTKSSSSDDNKENIGEFIKMINIPKYSDDSWINKPSTSKMNEGGKEFNQPRERQSDKSENRGTNKVISTSEEETEFDESPKYKNKRGKLGKGKGKFAKSYSHKSKREISQSTATTNKEETTSDDSHNHKNKKSKSEDTTIKENEVKNDLAALNCIPSLNDIFLINDSEEEGIGLTFEAIVEHQSTESHENSENKNIENCSNNNIKAAEKKIDSNASSASTPVLSQKTRIKQTLNKFRFIPKDTQSSIDVDKKQGINVDTSRKDVSETEEISAGVTKMSCNEVHNVRAEEKVKKFTFKKVETMDSDKKNIFESQEDPDLDI